MNYLCQNLQKNNYVKLTEGQMETLMSGVFSGLSKYSDLTETALEALKFSTDFLNEKMSDQNVSDYIYQTLVTLL